MKWFNKQKQKLLPEDLARMWRNRRFQFPVTKEIGGRFRKFFDLSSLRFSEDFSGRAWVMGIAFGLLFSGVLARYAYLSLMPSSMRQKLRHQANGQFEREVTLAAPRGQIVDRNGRALAVSILQPSLFINPKRIPAEREERLRVARQLGIPFSQLEEWKKAGKSFVWIKRQMSHGELAKFGDLSEWQDFIGVIEEPKRFYPEKDLAAHLIGYVGVDNKGLDGVEAVFNERLKGEAITAKVTRDARGKITLTTPNGAVKPEPSTEPLRLSIDLSIQSYAKSALKTGMLKARARYGSAVVMDSNSGEILAIASYPNFDLNDPPEPSSEKRRFHPVMDALELGSIVKPIFIAKALDKGVARRDETLFCENGRMPIPGKVIKDDHPHGSLSISGIIKVSSNICTYKLMKRLGRTNFYHTIFSSGLGRSPGTGLLGEWSGRVEPPQQWREVRFANMAFGQGIALSPLQATRALAILARGGRDVPVKILAAEEEKKEIVGPQLQYVSEDVARDIVKMMSTVVEEEGGTGRLAAIEGIRVAGKTGTAEKFDPKTKRYSERTASFLGTIPADNPRLVIAVVIDEPQVRPAYGGVLAGPVFAEIGEKTIQYLNAQGVLPLSDKLSQVKNEFQN